MRITFVTCGSEGLGLQYLSAMLKKAGHEVSLVFDPALFDDKVFLNIKRLAKIFDLSEETAEDVIRSQPDLVGISVVSDIYPWAQEIARLVKSEVDVPILMGGIHPTLVPEKVIADPNVDMLCLGEGEEAVVELANSLAKGEPADDVKNIWFKRDGAIIKNPLRPLIEDLDTLPFPDRTIYEGYVNTKDSQMAMSSRGCVFNCSYCFNNAMKKLYAGKGRYLRRRSPKNFVAELVAAKRRYNFRFLKIYDDIFTYDIAWLKEFAPLYKKAVGRPFFCLGHPRFMREEAIKLLKEAGCGWVQIGIESLNEKTRRESCERPETNEEIFRMRDTLDKYNLAFEPDHIFGLPGDSEKDYQSAARFYKSCQSLLKVNTNILSYIPETKIIEEGLKHNMIQKSDLESISEGREGCRVGLGSERDEKRRMMYKGYVALFKALPLIPQRLLEWVLGHNLQRFFGIFDPWLGYMVRLLVMDHVDRLYIKDNLTRGRFWLRRKFRV